MQRVGYNLNLVIEFSNVLGIMYNNNNNNLYLSGFSLYKRKIIEGNILWVVNVRIVAIVLVMSYS